MTITADLPKLIWVKFKDGHVEWMTQDDGLTSGSLFF